MKYFLGYSTDKRIRNNSSGGGMVTAMLVYLLENKKIDGALVCRMDRLKPVQFIAKTREEIISAAQSKYLEFDLSNSIKLIRKFKGRIAVVGIPCQLMVMRKLFGNRISYYFGLYCGCSLRKDGLMKILDRLKISVKDIKEIKFREGEGYGRFIVYYTKDGKILSKSVSKDAFNYLFTLYIPDKCSRCKDFFNEYSDISFGDCWIKSGYTSIYPKSNKMILLLRNAEKNNNIHLEAISKKDFFNQHRHSIGLKKKRMNLKKYEFLLNSTPFQILDLLSKTTKKIKRKTN